MVRKFWEIDLDIEKSDIFVFLVSHNEFKNLTVSNDKIVIDFAGLDKINLLYENIICKSTF